MQRLEGDKSTDLDQFLAHKPTAMSSQEKKNALLDIKKAIFTVLHAEEK